MKLKDVIELLILEVEYRTDEGIVDFKKPKHIQILAEVMDKAGLSDIKSELIKNLMEGDDFKNNTLQKVVTYRNEKGEEVENTVGNLLRLPADDPGRVAANKQLPTDSEEREKVMNALGSENQPARDDSSTDDSDGEDGGEDDFGMGEPEMGTTFDGESGEQYRDNLPDGDPAKEDDGKQDDEDDVVVTKNEEEKIDYPKSSYKKTDTHKYNFSINLEDDEQHKTDFYNLEGAIKMKKILEDDSQTFTVTRWDANSIEEVELENEK
jgi:hypothetical protein